MLKKGIIILLASALCLSMAGCGGSKTTGSLNVEETTTTTKASETEDSENTVAVEENEVSFEDVSVGDTVYFGSYEQDGDTSNGAEQIEWQVIDEQDGALLLVSEYILSKQPYNSSGEDATWENCSLRTWLNETFLNEAFSESEQDYICTTTVATGTEEKWESVESENTQDKVFILSTDEVAGFWEDYGDRRAVITAAAYEKQGSADYWLRCNTINNDARYLDYIGYYTYEGEARSTMAYLEVGVRPALWVSINADNSAEPMMGDTSVRYTQVGDTVTFGSNTGYLHEWIVLEIEDDRLMLLSKECLTSAAGIRTDPFDTNGGSWAGSSLRAWLNGEFLTDTFTEDEIAQIQTTYLVTSGSDDTEDQVFLLSKDEVEGYFPTRDERIVTVESGGTRGWWLRDECSSATAYYVDQYGQISFCGYSFDGLCIRPAIWIQNEDYLIYANAYQY